MSGLSMMMKSMGIDPAEIEQTVKTMGQMVIDMKASIDRVETKIDSLILIQAEITDNFTPETGVETIGGNSATENLENETNG